MKINDRSGTIQGTYLVANGFAKSWGNAKPKTTIEKDNKNRKVEKSLKTSQYDFHV